MERTLTWKDIDTVILKITGKWILGVIVQEDASGRKRLKLFKGRIKDDGNRKVEYKGKEIKFSMIQRFNIPSEKYWIKLNREMLKVISKYLGKEQRYLPEF
ncbi:MAG: hypothetical protein QW507_00485 [Candidatus Nanoarchaeia archaeon]|nr:hypothetical protein [Candidatus Haiyanarchaeum thermophilum]MCW1302942.1 hypothetical protein [Candidatus Haiyanarchaeum thermophilum]MCW1303620.1 hypothetical protein [Candidatus Haiyanarchaeum thermophilum]MCW1306301.1 hypothetical protein [Candidatus Haiyanarchaeum thermophilum]MCW1307189.1 hypothetical protein [Candidatus Haiyanarchaeum thermophilum]